MKKILIVMLAMLPLSIFAQKFGYVNSVEIMQVMPEYTKAQNDLAALQKQYADEFELMRSELEKLGTAYEKEKDTLPINILQRREQELQERVQRLQQFEQDSYAALQQEQQKRSAELNQMLLDAIDKVGVEGGYVCVFDTSGAVPYISTTLCEDVTVKVKAKLGISENVAPAVAK